MKEYIELCIVAMFTGIMISTIIIIIAIIYQFFKELYWGWKIRD